MKTKDKILLISQEMFNLLGEPQVSTVDIATELEISPGNLYYHFRNKEEIISEQFRRLEMHMIQALAAGEMSLLNPIDGWLHLKFIFEIIWDYRFIYRDINHLLEKNSDLGGSYKRLLRKKRESIRFILEACEEHQLLSLPPPIKEGLVENIVMITTYAMSYHTIRQHKPSNYQLLRQFNINQIIATSNANTETPAGVLFAMEQVMLLVMPYLEQHNRDWLLYTLEDLKLHSQ